MFTIVRMTWSSRADGGPLNEVLCVHVSTWNIACHFNTAWMPAMQTCSRHDLPFRGCWPRRRPEIVAQRADFDEVARGQFEINPNLEDRGLPNQPGTNNIGFLTETGARSTHCRLIPSLEHQFRGKFAIDPRRAPPGATQRRLLSMGSPRRPKSATFTRRLMSSKWRVNSFFR